MLLPGITATVIQRQQALTVDTTRDSVPRQMVRHQSQTPMASLPNRAVLLSRVRQRWVRFQPAAPFNTRILFTLDAIHFVQPLLKLRSSVARRWFGPASARSLRALDYTVVLRSPRRVPRHFHSQANQPQRQLRRKVTRRAPGTAVI